MILYSWEDGRAGNAKRRANDVQGGAQPTPASRKVELENCGRYENIVTDSDDSKKEELPY